VQFQSFLKNINNGRALKKVDESFEEKEHRPEIFLRNENIDESFERKKT
jgi:hypothetical protein